MKYLLSLLVAVLLFSCKDPVMSPAKKPEVLQDKFETAFKSNKGRDVWQRPGEVLDLLGDIKNKTIADIGAGTGFFSFRLLFREANVIAVDIDPAMLEIVEDFKMNLNEENKKRISTRLALPQDSKIKKDEVHIFMIINTIGYIENRKSYLQHLYDLLPTNGRIMIVDFKRKSLPIDAPALKYRVPLFELENELQEIGFTLAESNDNLLDYQYVLIGDKK